jgi:hypothetical protein
MTLTACQGGAAPLTESGREKPAAPSADGPYYSDVEGIIDKVAEDAHLGADITAAFTDRNFLAAVRESLGKEAIEPIYANEVAAVTELDVSGRGVASLNGLEYFISLRYLSCEDNLIEDLDLARLPELRGLRCQYNRLTSLDFTGNKFLEELNCANNQITAINVLGCDNLFTLVCRNNALASEKAIIGTDTAGLWSSDFHPQNVITPREPLSQEMESAVAAAPPIQKSGQYYSYAGIDPRLGPGPFSVNDLIELYGEPESLIGKRISFSCSFGIIARFKDVKYNLVSRTGELSFDPYANSKTKFKPTEADLDLRMYPYWTIIFGGDFILPGGIYIGGDRESVVGAYAGDEGSVGIYDDTYTDLGTIYPFGSVCQGHSFDVHRKFTICPIESLSILCYYIIIVSNTSYMRYRIARRD